MNDSKEKFNLKSNPIKPALCTESVQITPNKIANKTVEIFIFTLLHFVLRILRYTKWFGIDTLFYIEKSLLKISRFYNNLFMYWINVIENRALEKRARKSCFSDVFHFAHKLYIKKKQ